MDDVVNRFAKELADAIAAAVAENPQVEACRARARDAGYDMRVTLEVVVGFYEVWMLCADRHRKCGGWLAHGGCARCGQQPRFWEREL